MPKNLKRYYGAGDLHFITCSCLSARAGLGSARRRDLYLGIFEQVRQRYGVVVLGYMVMPEHVHLLISEPQRGTPSTVMQALNLWQSPPPTHIWQLRFYDFNVWTEHKRTEKLRYMHRNPVKRDLVQEPDQWPWSSFRAYAYGEPGPVGISDW